MILREKKKTLKLLLLNMNYRTRYNKLLDIGVSDNLYTLD